MESKTQSTCCIGDLHLTNPNSLKTELFDVYTTRLVRKHIVQQYVNSEHQVFIDEQTLIDRSTNEIRDNLLKNVDDWKMAKMIIINHIRCLAKNVIKMHDIDKQTHDIAMESIYREEFNSLFPHEWMDS